jgi:hypothetical protein
VSIRWVKLLPGPVATVCTRLDPRIRSVALVVVTEPLLLLALVPELARVTSTGLLGSAPLYSRTRISGYLAALVKVTVTLFAPAAAEAMFFA